MNKNLTNFIFFAAGIAIGALSTWKFVKTKYEKIANEEIESVKEVFLNKSKDVEKREEREEIDIRKEGAKEYKTLVNDLHYSNDDEEDADMDDIYVISPADFGENDFDTETLTYYADGVLTDEVDEVIDNVDAVVGSDSLNHFGEYEDDSVFVRNERLGIDYEILLDVRKYHDIYKNE